MSAILMFARLTFREAARRRILTSGFVLGAVFLLLYNAGFFFIRTQVHRSGETRMLPFREMCNFIVMAGLYASNFLAVAMSTLVAADTLAGQIESGTIQSLATKPVRRIEIVLGKWVGFVSLLFLYLVLMSGGVLLSVQLQAGYHPPNVSSGLALLFLEGLVVISLTLAASSRWSALATGGVVLGMYGIGLVGGWVEQIGTVVGNETAQQIGIVSSLLMPTEALWKRASWLMTSPLVRASGVSPFASGYVPSPFMVWYAGLYFVGAVALAARNFARRDL